MTLMESQKQRFAATFFCSSELFLSLARALRSPGVLRISPVDRFQQITHLCSTQRHHTNRPRRPHEATAVQPLGVERQSDPVMPQGFNQRTCATAEHEDVAHE